jgi:anti-sigma B factor antagonist
MNEFYDSELISSCRQQGDAIFIALTGEIDLHNSPDLRGILLEKIEQCAPKRLVLNLEKVPYMDSSGLAVLVESMQKLRKIGSRIYLTHLQARVLSIIEIARLNTVFNLAKDDNDASIV